MRLDKYIATVSDYSRKEVRKAIKQGEVSVNGEVVTDNTLHIAEDAEVVMNGYALRQPQARYIMLHKPKGVICATRDSHQPTVIDLLDVDNPERLHIAGRLDIDTTGLVLITDDGQWSHRVTSPRHQCDKLYEVETALPISNKAVETFEKGIFFEPENKRTRPAQLTILGDHHAELTISEGKYHQVKRMFEAIDNEVVELHRSRIGSIELDQYLLPGEYRELSDEEINSIN